jgi:hypothetical protein
VDEVEQFCSRVLADPALAAEAVSEARASDAGERLGALAAAGRACRARAALVSGPPAEPGSNGDHPAEESLDGAVARELSIACAELAERHRETLALRELLGLGYREIASVIGVEEAAVGPLLSRARLRLRGALRGTPAPGDASCDARDRALRTLARRQDAEPMSDAEEDWLLDHLGSCPTCERDHAAMLEASACYRAWPPATA